MHAGSDESRDVRHVGEQWRPDAIGGPADPHEIDHPRGPGLPLDAPRHARELDVDQVVALFAKQARDRATHRDLTGKRLGVEKKASSHPFATSMEKFQVSGAPGSLPPNSPSVSFMARSKACR